MKRQTEAQIHASIEAELRAEVERLQVVLELENKLNNERYHEIERLSATVSRQWHVYKAEIDRLLADNERLRALLREAANEIDELGFPSKADKFLSAIASMEAAKEEGNNA